MDSCALLQGPNSWLTRPFLQLFGLISRSNQTNIFLLANISIKQSKLLLNCIIIIIDRQQQSSVDDRDHRLWHDFTQIILVAWHHKTLAQSLLPSSIILSSITNRVTIPGEISSTPYCHQCANNLDNICSWIFGTTLPLNLYSRFPRFTNWRGSPKYRATCARKSLGKVPLSHLHEDFWYMFCGWSSRLLLHRNLSKLTPLESRSKFYFLWILMRVTFSSLVCLTLARLDFNIYFFKCAQ